MSELESLHKVEYHLHKPWVMTQTWEKLCFLHWNVNPRFIEQFIPAPLKLDTFSNQAWISIIPFSMKQMRFRLLPPIPYAHTWYECNVRTYVTYEGKAGVFFFTLDANHWLGGKIAKKMWGLPYRYVKIDWQEKSQQVSVQSFEQTKSMFQLTYQPVSEKQQIQSGTLDHWLLERYVLFSKQGSQLYCGEIHHSPWFIQEAVVEIKQNDLLQQLSLPIPNQKPLVHFADYKQMWAGMPLKV